MPNKMVARVSGDVKELSLSSLGQNFLTFSGRTLCGGYIQGSGISNRQGTQEGPTAHGEPLVHIDAAIHNVTVTGTRPVPLQVHNVDWEVRR